jgi:hypothetical protein
MSTRCGGELLGVELGEDVDLVYLAVDAVAHQDINQPEASPNGHLKSRDTATDEYLLQVSRSSINVMDRNRNPRLLLLSHNLWKCN